LAFRQNRKQCEHRQSFEFCPAALPRPDQDRWDEPIGSLRRVNALSLVDGPEPQFRATSLCVMRYAALPLTGIRRTFSFAASVLGRLTVNTPFVNVAATLSG
jgi:hypothetical protein